MTDLGAVDQNLTLPAVSEGTVTWVSDKPEILDNTGVIYQDAVTGDSETVNLYAIVNNSGVKTVQKYEVTVNKEVKVPSELDDLDINEIVGDQPADALVKGFTLPAQTAGGTQITWTSSDASVIEIVNGTQAVIKPGDALKNAALTAEITVGGQKISRVFPLGVAAAGPMDAELDINEIVGQDLSDIQADFTLPEETKSGYPVTWESSLPESLFVHGGKAYVIRQIDPTDVTLSALIVKDGVENRVDYKLTIGKAPEVTSFLVNENFENIEVGKLPENTAVNQWGKDASISDDNPNIDIGVQQENETNKVLNVHHIEADGNQHGMMHLSFNAPKRGTIAVEYRYRYVVTDGGTPAKNTNANVWVNQTTGHTVAPSGNFVRLPFNDGFVVAQLGGSISERMNYANGNWHTMKAWLDLDQGLVTAYVDDQVLCKDAPKFQGDGAMRLQIGFDSANRGRCQLDDIKIYIDPVSVVTNYAKSIDLGDLSAVMKDLEIPDKTPLGDADIMWVSSNPEVISTTGKVNHPTDKDSVSVTLWALVENEGNRSLRTFNAIVPRLKTDEESVALDFADLNLATAGLLLADELHLPTVGAQGSTITWSSSHPAIIANDGKVSRIPYDTEKITEVTLTATVSKGNAAAKSKTFTFRVPERNYVLDATVTGSSSLGNKRFEFIKDNDSTTAWAPSADDKEQTLTITLPKAKMVNMIKVNGSCGSVSMSYQTEGNNTYQRLGSGMAVEFSPKLVKTVKFEFTDVEEISSIGIYYTLTDQEAVEKDMEALNLGDLNSVTSNIKIPTVGAVCGSKITAKSSDTRYLSDKGAVTRPSASEGDVDVVLTLTFTFGNYSVSKDYTVHILKNTSGGSGGGSGSGSSHAGGGSGTPNVAPPVTNPDNGGTQDAFPDIKDITWAKAAINNFAAKGFINGNEAGNFEPDRMISREEFLKMVLNAFGLKTGGATCDFADVPEDSWYYGYVATAYQLGIVNGVGDGKFGSGQPILRCDMAVMIQKAAEAANLNRNAGVEKQFADEADIPAYAIESVKNLSGLGVINGFEDNTFRPADEASRAQAVVMLYNYLNRK